MSADYLPVHDPAVHGPAYAVRVTGQHTQPFTAVRPDEELDRQIRDLAGVRPYVPQAAPLPVAHGQYEQPCPYGCPVHPSPLGGDPRALLYAGPGIANRTWEARVREGAWDDIPAEFDAAHARVHLPAIKGNRNIRSDVSSGRYKIAAAFDANPGWRTDAKVAEGLHAAEAALTAGLAEMKRRAAEREGRRAA